MPAPNKLISFDISVQVSADLTPKELGNYIREAILTYGKLNYKTHPAYKAYSKIQGITIRPIDKSGRKQKLAIKE